MTGLAKDGQVVVGGATTISVTLDVMPSSVFELKGFTAPPFALPAHLLQTEVDQGAGE